MLVHMDGVFIHARWAGQGRTLFHGYVLSLHPHAALEHLQNFMSRFCRGRVGSAFHCTGSYTFKALKE